MEPKMKIVLIAEDRYSAGRWITVIGIGLLILFLYMDLSRLLTGNLKVYQKYTTTDWVVFYMSYIVAIVFIVLGIVAHRLSKWPEFVEELYPDGWIRYRVIRGNYTSFESCVPSDLIIRISKYKKKYSKRRGMWYIRFNFDIFYENKAYTAVSYGWLKEPKDLREFEKYVNYIKEQAKKNTEGKQVKITFSNSGYSLDSWNEIDYAKKFREEKEKLISGDDGEQS